MTPDAARILGLLSQVQEALERFAASGERASFDLRGLPMTRAEEVYVEQLLGRGEVTARLHALGESDAWETALPGVWFVVHHDPSGHVLGRFIEVGPFPALLGSQPADVREAVSGMRERVQRAAAELEAAPQPGEAP
jgi:hypothetical protein